ncbi:hypothetical protein H4S08_002718 [Coemansia sp. RSA 1365]|nr:hypothetical protein H4S08_002718 [Coemansia sp. RSA 1365]
MTTDLFVEHNTGAMQQSQIRKEPDGLPKPSTMPAAQREQPTASQKLIWILQYLNPLFYARLAQSLVSTVFGSQTAGSANILGNHITEHVNQQVLAPVPADASVIDCEYYHISKNSMQNPQSESQRDLGIVPNYPPVTSAVATSNEHPTKIWNNTVQSLSVTKAEEKLSTTSLTYDGSDAEEIDLSSRSTVPMDPTTESITNTTVATAAKTISATVLNEEKPSQKNAKKGKRSKKNRG